MYKFRKKYNLKPHNNILKGEKKSFPKDVELFTGWGFFPVEKERRIGNILEEAPTFLLSS
jgi:hypothetical protein